MRDKFRNKSSEWKYRKILSNESWFKHISDCREVMRPWWNKDVSSWKWKVNSSIISPDKEYPHTYINGCVVFFFSFPWAGKINYFFFFLKKMSTYSAGDDGGICTSPRWMFSSPCVWPWIWPEFLLSVFQRHWNFPSTK